MSRLTIQYTIEMEEIQTEVGRLIDKAGEALLEINQEKKLSSDLLSYQTLEQIDKLRRKLNRMDHNLNDASNIISGYLSYKAAQSAKTQIEEYQTEQNEIPASD